MTTPLPKYYLDGRPIGAAALAGAMRKGWEAQKAGVPRHKCPYDRGATALYGNNRCGPTFERAFARIWLEGWEAASNDDQTIFHGKETRK